MIMTGHQIAISIAEMKPVSFTTVELLTIQTDSTTHPQSIAKYVESVSPNIPKTIAVYVSLTIVFPHTEASGYVAVDSD